MLFGALIICGLTALIIRLTWISYTISNPSLNRSIFWLNGWQEIRLPAKLANGADPNKTDRQGMSAMHWAGWYGSGESMRLLIASGGNVNQRDKLGRTPLFYAAHNITDNGALIVLLGAGGNVNAQDNFGYSALFEAVKLGATRVTKGVNVELLMKAGANINLVSKDGSTVLHHAASTYYPKWGLIPIIEAGAKINAQDNQGGTAIFSKGLYASVENQTLLLEAGADPHLKTAHMYSACTYPYWSGDHQSDLLKKICGRKN